MTKRGKVDRSPRVPTYKTAQEKPHSVSTSAGKGRDSAARRAGQRQNNLSVEEMIKIFSRRPEWAEFKAKLLTGLESMGLPKESAAEASHVVIKRILGARLRGIEIAGIRWPLLYEIALSYFCKPLPEGEKRRHLIYSEQIAKLGLTLEEQSLAFHILRGLGNKEIAEKIERGPDAVKKRVSKLRKKLGIRAVGLDDRVNTVLTLLGLK
jgi:DNA-binding CsgD family transcriptional regulator